MEPGTPSTVNILGAAPTASSLGPTRKPRVKADKPHPYQGAKRGRKPEKPKTSAIPALALQKQNLTTYDWLQVLAYVDANPKASQTKVVNHFANLQPGYRLVFDQSSLSRNIKGRKKIEARAAATPNGMSSKRDRIVTRPDVEQTLYLWTQKMNSQNETVSDAMLIEKRRRFESLLDVPQEERLGGGSGWLLGFKKTYNIRKITRHGEAASCNKEAVEAERLRCQAISAEYAPCDELNTDESSLYWKCPPDKGLAMEEMSGKKASKNRITILFAVWADGTKEQMLFIGNAKQPRCFKRKSGADYGLLYEANKKAWMTRAIFQPYLIRLDERMRKESRHVLFWMDNFSAHFVDYTPANVQVEPYEANMTPFVQPLDAGIIRTFKAKYRTEFCQRALDREEAGESNLFDISILEAMLMSKRAWNAVKQESIVNCWAHTKTLAKDPNNEFKALNSDEQAWKVFSMYAGDEINVGVMEHHLEEILGARFRQEPYWRKTMDALIECEPDEDIEMVLTNHRSAASSQFNHPNALPHAPSCRSSQLVELEENLLNQITQLQNLNKLKRSNTLSIHDFLEPVEEHNVGQWDEVDDLKSDQDFVDHVLKERAAQPEEEEEDEGFEITDPELSSKEIARMCERLEKACLSRGDPEQSLALSDALCKFRGHVRREEVTAMRQETLDKFFKL